MTLIVSSRKGGHWVHGYVHLRANVLLVDLRVDAQVTSTAQTETRHRLELRSQHFLTILHQPLQLVHALLQLLDRASAVDQLAWGVRG